MNVNKKIQIIQHVIRVLGLLPVVERFREALSIVRYHFLNKKFLIENPSFNIPPKTLAYDAYSAPDWSFYKKSGEETAKFLSEVANKFIKPKAKLKVFEWGCGPARVIRHIPLFFSTEDQVYGSDYNKATIEWCVKNFKSINFKVNDIQPPLNFEADTFDFIYSISVFTHLSESNSHKWISELFRIAKPGAVLVISINGDSRKKFMLPHELKSYLQNGILIRANFEEGKKMFFACHSPKYITEKLFKEFEVLDFVSEGFPYTGQDCWILKKPAN